MPIKKLRILFLIKGIVVPPTFLALFLWGAIVTKGGGPLVTGHAKMTSTYMNTVYSSLTALNVIIGLFSSMAVNFPDFSRFSKNNLSGYNQVRTHSVTAPSQVLMNMIPVLCPSHHWNSWSIDSYLRHFCPQLSLGRVRSVDSKAYCQMLPPRRPEANRPCLPEWYMPAVIAKFDSRAAKFFTAASFMLATIGNQIAAGTYPFSNDISGLCPKYLNIFRATLIISVFCVVSNPWQIIKNAAGLLAFLSGYSMFMGAICGTMVCQYYIILKKKLNIHELYNGHGIYRYNKYGINWRAYAAFLVAIGPLLPGFCKSIDTNLDVGGAWKIYTFSCLYGFVASGLVYYLICTYISDVGPAKIDEAVYPPAKTQTDVEVGSADSEEASYEEKKGAVGVSVGTKELGSIS